MLGGRACCGTADSERQTRSSQPVLAACGLVYTVAAQQCKASRQRLQCQQHRPLHRCIGHVKRRHLLLLVVDLLEPAHRLQDVLPAARQSQQRQGAQVRHRHTQRIEGPSHSLQTALCHTHAGRSLEAAGATAAPAHPHATASTHTQPPAPQTHAPAAEGARAHEALSCWAEAAAWCGHDVALLQDLSKHVPAGLAREAHPHVGRVLTACSNTTHTTDARDAAEASSHAHPCAQQHAAELLTVGHTLYCLLGR